MNRALEDGIISTDKIRLPDGTLQMSEAQEIESLQRQISEITNKVSEAQNEAKFQMLGVKYKGSALDADSFANLQEELKTSTAAMAETYDNALMVTLSDLNLRLSDGSITQEKYDKLVEKATSGYQAKMDELNVKVESFNLGIIAETWKDELSGILPGMEGSLSERLSNAMHNAIAIKPDAETWTPEEVKRWFGLEGIDDPSVLNNIVSELKQTAAAIPQQMKEELYEMPMLSADKWKKIRDGETESPMLSMEKWLNLNIRETDMSETYSQIDELKKNTDNYVGTAFSTGTTVTMPLGVNIDYKVLNPSASVTAAGGGNSSSVLITAGISSYSAAGQKQYETGGSPSKHAAGGFVTGRQLSWLAEEGYGEFVIPTNPSRRGRAIELYEQAGVALGVSAYANGGYIDGSIPSSAPSGNPLSGREDKNVPLAYNGFSEGNDYGETINDDTPSSIGSAEGMGGTPVQVNVNVSPEFVIHGGNGQDSGDIAQAISKHMKEMADALGGEIADRLQPVFSNMPLKEA